MIAFPKRASLMILSLFFIGCDTEPPESLVAADIVYKNARVYTVEKEQEWADGFAITNGKFVYVGSDHEALQTWIGKNTKVVDLNGKLVLPGLYDSHLHPIDGSLQHYFEFYFAPQSYPNGFEEALKKFASESDDLWIRGGAWNLDSFPPGGPHKKILDAIMPDRPIALRDLSYHHLWVNSKALELANIHKDSPEIPNGEIVRDATGEPTGWLKEKAAHHLESFIPPHSKDTYIKAAKLITQKLNAYGVVAATDASVQQIELDAYQALAEKNELTVKMNLAVRHWINKKLPSNADLNKESIQFPAARSDYVKIFLDGVPFSHTSAMIEAYHDQSHHAGQLFFDQVALDRMVEHYDNRGNTVKIHATGDAAVRAALNAIEHARKANPASELKHQVAHSEFVSDKDIPRFAKVNAIAEVSPALWHAHIIHDVGIQKAVGKKRKDSQWPIADLLHSGALVISGSDWPAGTNTPDPWASIEAMITREDPLNIYEGSLNPAQGISLKDAIAIHTINGARALDEEDTMGSIKTGKLANFIVLNHNIFDLPPTKISDTEVITTVFKGKTVYENKAL